MSKDPSPGDDALRYHLISRYRDLISRRYDDVIEDIARSPVPLSRDVALEIRQFFLEHIYPEPARRKVLDKAFGELRNFTTNPALIWGLIGSLPVALFQFGAQLPAAIRAGLTALQAYTSAVGFEESLLRAAIDKGYNEPLTDGQFLACIRAIPRRSLDTFINETTVLFTMISDTALLSRTILIMEDVIKRMKSKPTLYSADQVNAIGLGLELMQNGYELLEPFTEDTKKEIIAFIAETERRFIAEVHGGG